MLTHWPTGISHVPPWDISHACNLSNPEDWGWEWHHLGSKQPPSRDRLLAGHGTSLFPPGVPSFGSQLHPSPPHFSTAWEAAHEGPAQPGLSKLRDRTSQELWKNYLAFQPLQFFLIWRSDQLFLRGILSLVLNLCHFFWLCISARLNSLPGF